MMRGRVDLYHPTAWDDGRLCSTPASELSVLPVVLWHRSLLCCYHCTSAYLMCTCRGLSHRVTHEYAAYNAASPATSRSASMHLPLLAVALFLATSTTAAVAGSVPRVSIYLDANCSLNVSQPEELNYALSSLPADGSCIDVTIGSVSYTLTVNSFSSSKLSVSSFDAGRQCSTTAFLIKTWTVMSRADNISCAQGTVWDRATEPNAQRVWYTLAYEDSSNSNSELSPAAIAGVVVAVVALIAVLLTAGFCWQRRQRSAASAGASQTGYAAFK
jgi:hypothetical protein